jgi:citrate synthase
MNPITRKLSVSDKGKEKDKEKIEKIQKDLTPYIPKSTEKCKLTLPDGREVELPILHGQAGPPMIDMRNLYSLTGYFTFDPGYTCTGSCVSEITFIDGEKGELLYRGYKIQDIAKNCDFVDVCYLLLYGALPSEKDKKMFDETMKNEMLVHEQLISFYKGFQAGAHPMAIMVGVVGALSAFFHNEIDVTDAVEREISAIRLVAKIPMIAAIAYRTAMGLPIVYPKKSLSYTENFLYMMFADPMDPDYKVDKFLAEVLDKILILHADHEQNASTATVRIAGSSLANPFACIAAGIASLWGPAHGGANEAVLEMLDSIGSVENIPACVEKAKDKNSKFRLMGFGHRVYKNYDPRAEIMRDLCHDVFEYLNIKDNIYLNIGLALEKVALSDKYFIDRKLYPNVDYYSGIVLDAIGIPKSMFTVIFALARSIGWIVQWREMMSESAIKIGRPRQLYVGHTLRDIIKVEDRIDTYEQLSDLKPPSKKGFQVYKP